MTPSSSSSSSARAFIDTVRQAHHAGGRPFKGQAWLPEHQKLAIRAAVASAATAAPGGSITPAIEERLLARFEEMARRTEFQVPDDLRHDILSLLVTELWVNQCALHASPKRLLSVTVQHGAIGPELVKDFPEFRETPGIFIRVASNAPADPGAALQEARQRIAALVRNDEFADLRDTPHRFIRAAVFHPRDPEGALRRTYSYAERQKTWRAVSNEARQK
jgi:hypothetical protein